MPEQQADIICESCGQDCRYDQIRRCWQCDAIACPVCLLENPEPLCPDCNEKSRLIEPMLPRLVKDVPREEGWWWYEFKWDGARTLCYCSKDRTKLISRNLFDVTMRYPELSGLASTLETSAIFDGEIVALESGRPSFSRLQKRMHVSLPQVPSAQKAAPVCYYIFDLLFFRNKWLLNDPYTQRRELLESLNFKSNVFHVPPRKLEQGQAILDISRKFGLEGVIAKRADSVYEPGRRSANWLKIKIVYSQEFIIAGYTLSEGSTFIAALLLGYYTEDKISLKYAGKVGTGFTETDQRILLDKLTRIKTEAYPFDKKISVKNIIFVKPQLVAEIYYRQWPDQGMLRQPSYKGLRNDKSPDEIIIER